MSAPVPLFRLQGHGDHFYTTSAAERDAAVSQYGYVFEGIACYVMDDGAAVGALTVRDQIALAALVAVIQNSSRSGVSHPKAWECAQAYAYADAMIVARGHD